MLLRYTAYTVVPYIAMTKLINPTTAKLCNYAQLTNLANFVSKYFLFQKQILSLQTKTIQTIYTDIVSHPILFP